MGFFGLQNNLENVKTVNDYRISSSFVCIIATWPLVEKVCYLLPCHRSQRLRALNTQNSVLQYRFVNKLKNNNHDSFSFGTMSQIKLKLSPHQIHINDLIVAAPLNKFGQNKNTFVQLHKPIWIFMSLSSVNRSI